MEINIEYCGVALRVVGDYQLAERATRDYPGCAEDFEVTEVYAADSKIDLVEIFTDEGVDMISDSVLEAIAEKRNGLN